MRLNLTYIFFILCIAVPMVLIGQEIQQDMTIENLLEQYIETAGLEDYDITFLTESVLTLADNPLNINKATEEDLALMFFLDPVAIRAILDYRDTYGPFLAVEELQAVDLLDMQKVKLLSYLVTVRSGDSRPFDLKAIWNAGEHSAFLKYKRILQDRAGYIADEGGNTNYVGTPDHYFARYRFTSGKALRAGFTMEKDPGEDFFTGSNKYGFDFYSGFLHLEGIHPMVKTLTVGDYAVSLGQGLIMHNSFGGSKSVFTVDIKKDGQEIRPFSSVNETNFFRGIATTLQPLPNMSLTLFYSNKNTDGTVNSDTTLIDDFGSVSSLARDGFHRTASEIARSGSINQQNYGGRLAYRLFRNFAVAINHLDYQFSQDLIPRPALYRQFQFQGRTFSNTSVDYEGRFRNINYFGEVSRSNNGGMSQMHSAIVTLDRYIDMAVSYRNYGADYYTLEANAFSEGTLPANEQGFYIGAEARPHPNWKVSSYIDIWSNPWLRFRVDQPGQGREAIIRVDYFKKRKYNAYIQYRYETKNLNSSISDGPVTPVIFTHSHRARLHFSYQMSKEVELRSRIETSWFHKDGKGSNGIMMYQDIFFKPQALPFSGNIRLAYFDVASFDSRIYTYENDLLYEFLIPFFQDRGLRSYLNFRYRLNKMLTWEMKIAQTLLDNQATIGSGNEMIDGNRRTEFKTQVRLRF